MAMDLLLELTPVHYTNSVALFYECTLYAVREGVVDDRE